MSAQPKPKRIYLPYTENQSRHSNQQQDSSRQRNTSSPNMSETKLDKLFNLRFCRLQKQWMSKKPLNLVKQQKKTLSTGQLKCVIPLTEQVIAEHEPSIIEDNLNNNIEEVNKPSASTSNSVSRRLDLLLQLYESTENTPSYTEVQGNEQNHIQPVEFEGPCIDNSRFNAEDTFEYRSSDFVTLDDWYQYSEGQLTYNLDEWNSEDTSLWEMDNFINSQWDEGNSLPYDRSFIMFMREVHDVPHSTVEEIQFGPLIPEDLDSQFLAEMSSRQLCQGITRFAKAARVLWREMAIRSLMREYNYPSRNEVLRPEMNIAQIQMHSLGVNETSNHPVMPEVFLSGSTPLHSTSEYFYA